MTISTIAILNGALALLMLGGLALTFSLGLRIHRVSNDESVIPAEPTSRTLHDEQLARAA